MNYITKATSYIYKLHFVLNSQVIKMQTQLLKLLQIFTIQDYDDH